MPRVIRCENGGANFEALKAQAIAARSVAYYAMANEGTICDSQACQVYTCAGQPEQIHFDAAAATAGQYLAYNNWLTYGFYVAGDPQVAPQSCIDTDNANVSPTEKWVTFNEGKTLYDVEQTALGFVFPNDINVNGYGQNRGCMSQWGARCLENNLGRNSTQILQFYYGADIKILQAQGPCVVEPIGYLETVTCDGVGGWAIDPGTSPTPIGARISFGGPHGGEGLVSVDVVADQFYPDLCDQFESCDHGFYHPVPRSLHDGQLHPIHAYALAPDVDPVELGASPGMLQCLPTVPTGVRRAIAGPESFDLWQFSSYWDQLSVDAATLAAIPAWQDVPVSPVLMRSADAPEVWLSDNGFRRLVADEVVAAAWRLDLNTAAEWELPELLAMPEGTPLWPTPVLIGDDGPVVYLLDDPQCLPGGDPDDPSCPPPPEPEPETTSDSASASDSSDSNPGSDTDDPNIPTEGGDPSEDPGPGSGADTSPALPPGYGETSGCNLGGDRAPAPAWLIVLLVPWLRRRP